MAVSFRRITDIRCARYAWRRWKFAWLTPKQPGKYTLLASAKDDKGGAQPDKHDKNCDPYVINYPLPIEVFVGDPYEAGVGDVAAQTGS